MRRSSEDGGALGGAMSSSAWPYWQCIATCDLLLLPCPNAFAAGAAGGAARVWCGYV